MKVTLDTNVLIRALVEDDPDQTVSAQAVLANAALIAIPLTVFCEVAWVLRSRYRLAPRSIATAIETILSVDTVVTDDLALQTGLAFLWAGGDFGDGAIAHQGEAMGGDIFISFDAKARALWISSGGEALEPAVTR